MAENIGSLQEKVDEQEQTKRQKFGTFAGVFTPTLLTVLGVIMYLREGWVVGNAGLLGAWLIILLAFTITTCTGLSMSSITTNIRIGAGGAYSIIAQSLGIEVGGISGNSALCFAGFGGNDVYFRFPRRLALSFPIIRPLPLILDVCTSLRHCLYQYELCVSYSIHDHGDHRRFACFHFRYIFHRYGIAARNLVGALFPEHLKHNFQGANFWIVFCRFFLAATGIMAGANMWAIWRIPCGRFLSGR